MKKLLSLLLSFMFILLLLPVCFASAPVIRRDELFLNRDGAENMNKFYIDDLSRGTVSFFSPEHEKGSPMLADMIRSLENVVQIVHSENCNFDFDAAFLLKDGTVTCTDRCGHYDDVENVVKLSDCASYALLSDGTIVVTCTGSVVLRNAIDIGGSYMNCFALTNQGRVVPIESFLPQDELNEIERWNNITAIVVDGRKVFGYSADGTVNMTLQTRRELDEEKSGQGQFWFSDEGEYGTFTLGEVRLIDEYYVDITNDGYDEHVVVIPFDYLSEQEEISHVIPETGIPSEGKKILVFSGLGGGLIYTDVVNTTRENRCEVYIRNDSGRWYFLKHYYDEQVPGWSEALEMYDLTNHGDEQHVAACEISMTGRNDNAQDKNAHEILMIEYDTMKSTGFPIAEFIN